jgi:hypothetical protein
MLGNVLLMLIVDLRDTTYAGHLEYHVTRNFVTYRPMKDRFQWAAHVAGMGKNKKYVQSYYWKTENPVLGRRP